jgi:ubiquinone/menaquinone biosynthesis C-methylase UbiE
VCLLDLTPALLVLARQEIAKFGVSSRIRWITEGTIIDLSLFPDSLFEAVLCTGGPLSHVYPVKNRQQALSKLVRVAKKDAPIFVSVMSKYGFLLATPSGWPEAVINENAEFQRILESGDCYKFGMKGAYCHFYTSQEMEKELKALPVEIIHKVGLEGLNIQEPALNMAANHPEAFREWLKIPDAICADPFVVDASSQMLFVVKKR